MFNSLSFQVRFSACDWLQKASRKAEGRRGGGEGRRVDYDMLRRFGTWPETLEAVEQEQARGDGYPVIVFTHTCSFSLCKSHFTCFL